MKNTEIAEALYKQYTRKTNRIFLFNLVIAISMLLLEGA